MNRILLATLTLVAAASTTAAQKEILPNEVWVASRSEGVLQRMDLDGTPVASFEVGSRPHAFCLDLDGNIWVGMRGADRGLRKFSPTGDPLLVIPKGAGGVYGVAVAADGMIWSVQSHPDSLVQTHPRTGETLARVELSGRARSIATDWMGDVWIALYEREGYVERYSSTGGFKDRIQVERGPVSLAAAGCCIWVSNQRSCSIQCISIIDGEIQRRIGFKGYAGDIAVDGELDVWVVIPQLDKVYRYDTDGNLLSTTQVGDRPMNISIDGCGSAWVVNAGDNTMTRISRDGIVLDTVDVGPNPVAFGDSTSFNVANFVIPRSDSDFDGFDNRNESIAGSNPLDASSIPATVEFLNLPAAGQTLNAVYTDPHNPGARYVGYLAYQINPKWAFEACVSCDPRMSEMYPADRLFRLTIGEDQFYPGFKGVLDPNGQAMASVTFPDDLDPNVEVYMGFITIDRAVGHMAVRTMSKPKRIDFNQSDKAADETGNGDTRENHAHLRR